MDESSARRFYAVLVRNHHARLIEKEIRAMHLQHPLSDDDLGALIRKMLDDRGYSIESLLAGGASNDVAL
jgi:uncharacterized protein YqeY